MVAELLAHLFSSVDDDNDYMLTHNIVIMTYLENALCSPYTNVAQNAAGEVPHRYG
jgi:hypothetical protein